MKILSPEIFLFLSIRNYQLRSRIRGTISLTSIRGKYYVGLFQILSTTRYLIPEYSNSKAFDHDFYLDRMRYSFPRIEVRRTGSNKNARGQYRKRSNQQTRLYHHSLCLIRARTLGSSRSSCLIVMASPLKSRQCSSSIPISTFLNIFISPPPCLPTRNRSLVINETCLIPPWSCSFLQRI